MKPLFTLICSFGLIAGASVHATFCPDGVVYITHVEPCQTYPYGDTPNHAYIGFAISEAPAAYSVDQKRVTLWLNSCPASANLSASLIGKKIRVSTRVNADLHDRGFGDQIDNYQSLDQMLAEAQVAPGSPIEFVNGTKNSHDNIKVAITGAASTDREIRAQNYGALRLLIDLTQRELHYYNSQGLEAFVQKLSPDEATFFAKAVSHLTTECPLQVTVSPTLMRVTKVSSSCVDLSLQSTNQNAG